VLKTLAVVVLLALTGCVPHKPKPLATPGPTIDQTVVAQHVAHIVKMLKDYTDDKDAARYEQEEIAAVQSDIDNFDMNGNLEQEIDKLDDDIRDLHDRDTEVANYNFI
jgi:hypothetical protein